MSLKRAKHTSREHVQPPLAVADKKLLRSLDEARSVYHKQCSSQRMGLLMTSDQLRCNFVALTFKGHECSRHVTSHGIFSVIM